MSVPQQYNPAQCPLCGEANQCLLTTAVVYQAQCWCAQEPVPEELLARVPEPLRNRACVCRSCVVGFRHEQASGLPRVVHPVRRWRTEGE